MSEETKYKVSISVMIESNKEVSIFVTARKKKDEYYQGMSSKFENNYFGVRDAIYKYFEFCELLDVERVKLDFMYLTEANKISKETFDKALDDV